MGKRGRKAQPNSRTITVSTRFSEAERLAMKQYATSIGVGMTKFIHLAVIDEMKRNNAPTEVYPNNPNQLSITDKVDQCTD
jgi:hypothetical protein